MAPMTEAERREIHELIAAASVGDQTAASKLEQNALTFEKANAVADIAYVLDRLSLLGLTGLRERISARLLHNSQAHPGDRPPWIG